MEDERHLRIVYFLEDKGHEQFIPPLVGRVGKALGMQVENLPTTASRYSRGNLIYQHFRSFIRDVDQRLRADVLIICVDEDCEGYLACHLTHTKRPPM